MVSDRSHPGDQPKRSLAQPKKDQARLTALPAGPDAERSDEHATPVEQQAPPQRQWPGHGLCPSEEPVGAASEWVDADRLLLVNPGPRSS